MNNEQKFSAAAEKERIAFESVVHRFKTLYENRNQVMYYHLVYNHSYTTFDCIMHVYSQDGQKIESNIIEIKVRNVHYNDLMLEEKKFNALYRLKKKESEIFNKVNVLYLNFTPKSTYLFNLDKVTIEWESRMCNKFTVISNEKEEKRIATLDILESNDMHYVFDPKASDKNLINKINEQKAQRCIFDSVNRLKDVK